MKNKNITDINNMIDSNLTKTRINTLENLMKYIDEQNIQALLDFSSRFYLTYSQKKQISDYIVLVAYGGGKDSSFIVACSRLIQLVLFKEFGETFLLRIFINRQIGMPDTVMENIHRTFVALNLYYDPHVELLLIDGNEVNHFDINLLLPEYKRLEYRTDILMNGHRTQGDGRSTFCNTCNLSLMKALSLASKYGKKADIILTGDSPEERRIYLRWVRKIADKLNIPKNPNSHGLNTFLDRINGIHELYYQDIYGEDNREKTVTQTVNSDKIDLIHFLSIFSKTNYKLTNHLTLLTDFLKFEFDELAFNFTETDCFNPALMAHLRGLKLERMYKRSYLIGINEYLNFGINLMRKKEFPDNLIDIIRNRYENAEAVSLMRDKVNNYVKGTLSLSESQLICMVYSPFTEHCKFLELYIFNENPGLNPYIADIHQLLSLPNESTIKNSQQYLIDKLESISGLQLKHIRKLYNSELYLSHLSYEKLISPLPIIFAGDPYKAIIETHRSENGPLEMEIISGR